MFNDVCVCVCVGGGGARGSVCVSLTWCEGLMASRWDKKWCSQGDVIDVNEEMRKCNLVFVKRMVTDELWCLFKVFFVVVGSFAHC